MIYIWLRSVLFQVGCSVLGIGSSTRIRKPRSIGSSGVWSTRRRAPGDIFQPGAEMVLGSVDSE